MARLEADVLARTNVVTSEVRKTFKPKPKNYRAEDTTRNDPPFEQNVSVRSFHIPKSFLCSSGVALRKVAGESKIDPPASFKLGNVVTQAFREVRQGIGPYKRARYQ